MNNSIIKIATVLMVVGLMMTNIQFEKPPHSSIDEISISFSINESQAYVEGLEMAEEKCWNTGETISICRYADHTCDISGQDPC